MATIGNVCSFPEDYQDPQDKLKKPFHLGVAMAIYDMWEKDMTMYGKSSVDWFAKMYKYSRNEQDTSVYENWFKEKNQVKSINDNNSRAPESYADVDFTPVTPAAKYIGIINSLMSKSDYKVRVKALNYECGRQREREKYKRYYNPRLVDPLRKEFGLPLPQYDFIPEDPEEMEMYEKYHGIPLPFELGIMDIAQDGFVKSRWVEQRVVHTTNFTRYSLSVGKICQDEDGPVYLRLIDPAKFITIHPSEETIDEEPPLAGHIESVQIKDIMATLLNDGYSHSDIIQMARQYGDKNNAPANLDYKKRDERGKYSWEHFFVDVMCYEYKSNDSKFMTERIKSNGAYEYKESEWGRIKTNYRDGRKRQTNIRVIQNLYEGKWVVGTNIVYDYGKSRNVIRPEKKKVSLTYVFQRVNRKSIVDSWVPMIDSLKKTDLKIQASKWAAAPKGAAIDLALMANSDIGYGKLQGKEVLKIRRHSGTYYYQTKSDLLNKGIRGSEAITELAGGIGPQLQEWLELFARDMAQIQEEAGITSAIAATPAGTGDKGLGVSEMEIDASNHALWPLREALKNLKEKASAKIVQKVRTSIKYDEDAKKYYSGILGGEKMSVLEAYAGVPLSDIAIEMVATPSHQRKQMILAAATESMKVGKSGQPGITLADFSFIEKELEKDNEEFASWWLIKAEKKSAARIEENKARLIQLQGEQNMKLQEQIETFKRQREEAVQALKNKGALDEWDKKYWLEQLKHANNMEALAREGFLEQQKKVEISGSL